MATALPGATADGCTLFAHNSSRPADEGQALLWAAGRDHEAGETVGLSGLTVPQVRRTYGFVGARPAGAWGCVHGVNEQGVAVGATPIRTRLRGEAAGLTGGDLVRLVLERAGGARQGVAVAADLIVRHGQGPYPGCPREEDHDNAFLIADGREAYLLAACGSHWAVQQVGGVRALNEALHLRQDWDRISPGLADLAIGRGWWPADGSKLDFAGALVPDERRGYPWWGLATRLLEERRGAVDHALMRRLLREPADEDGPAATTGMIAQTTQGEGVPVAWWSFGPAGAGLFFPVPVVAEPPQVFRAVGSGEDGCELWRRTTRDGPVGAEARSALADLQARFDQMAGDFTTEAAALKRQGDADALRRLAESFTQNNWERFEEVWDGMLGKEAAWEAACKMDAV